MPALRPAEPRAIAAFALRSHWSDPPGPGGPSAVAKLKRPVARTRVYGAGEADPMKGSVLMHDDGLVDLEIALRDLVDRAGLSSYEPARDQLRSCPVIPEHFADHTSEVSCIA